MQLQLRELLPLGQEQQLGEQLVLELQLGEQQLELELGEEQLVRGAGEQLPGEQLGEAEQRILFGAWSRWVTVGHDMICQILGDN